MTIVIFVRSVVMVRQIIVDQLNVLSFNATSIRGKLLEFNSHFDAHGSEFDVISLTETWLNDSVFDGEILFNSAFNIFRKDRDNVVSNKKDGGGVLIAVKSNFSAIRRIDLESDIEIIWLEITLSKNCKAFLGTVYLPPYANSSTISLFEDSLERVRSAVNFNDKIMIFGDFNMPDILWEAYDGRARCANIDNISRLSSDFLDVISGGELVQHNTLPTCNDKPLDLIFTNDLRVTVDHSDNPTSSTHQALDAVIDLTCLQSDVAVSRLTYNFKRADFGLIFRFLACVCWSDLRTFNSVNDSLCYFYHIIFGIINECVPVVNYKPRKFPYWYSAELISLIKAKQHAHQAFVRTGRDKTSSAYQNFSQIRIEVKSMQRKCHLDYVEKVENDIKLNPKRFWSYVKSLKNSPTLPNVMSFENTQHSTLKDIAMAFCKYFESVFVLPTNDLPECVAHDVPLFKLPIVTPDRMKSAILSLKSSCSSGYGNVPVTFLKTCAEHLSFPLSIIFNQSVTKGEYPLLLKLNNVVPVYKQKGDKSHVESYRPICIQPIISKIFEAIVNDALRKHVKSLICDEQHGFTPNKSTVTNLLCYKDFISKSLDDSRQVHSIYTDFSKAFDSVPHSYLLLKLKNQFGVEGTNLLWFQSYLSDRLQRVVLSGIESEWVSVTSGVPQGSIIGPSLFIMYVNDIPSHIRSSNCLLYADDVKIFKNVSSLHDCIELQNDLSSFENWCFQWKLSLNLDKCCHLNFSLKRKFNITFNYVLNGRLLDCVKNVKDLGVYFSWNLNFSHHIVVTTNKAYRMMGFIKRTMKSSKDIAVFKLLYNSYVRSNLDYCSQVWSPEARYLTNKIERIQKMFVRHLCFVSKMQYDSSNYVNLCKHYRLSTLEHRRKLLDVTTFHKILHSSINCPYLVSSIHFNIPVKRTRHTCVFASEKKCRIGVRKHDFLPRTIKLVNSLTDVDIFKITNSNALKHCLVRESF